MTNLASAVPAPFQAAFGAMAVSPYPLFNLVCTNVPGPQIPLYAQGKKLISYYPIVPVGFDMGVCCAIFSYEQKLHVGLNSDVGACDDVDRLRDFIDEAFAELRAVALSDETSMPLELKRVPVARTSKPKQVPSTTKSQRAPVGKKRTKKAGSKTPDAKRRVAKKKAVRKAAPKATAVKIVKVRKTAAKKGPAKKAAAKRTAANKAAGTRRVAKKVTAKKATAKRTPAKKSAAKKKA